MGKKIKELELHFLRCTRPSDAFQFKKTIKCIGLSSTFTFIDSVNAMKLTAKLTFKNQEIFEKAKKLPVFIRFGKIKNTKKKNRSN